MIQALLVFGGVLVALVVLMMLIGACLPANHVASRRAVFHRSPAELYAVASDFAATASWRSGLQKIEMLPARDGQVCYREISSRRAVTYLVIGNDPEKKLVLKILDEGLPFGGTWTIEFAPATEGASVRITEHGEVKNALFRFLSRFVFGYTSSMDAYLRDLGRKYGEQVAPEQAN